MRRILEKMWSQRKRLPAFPLKRRPVGAIARLALSVVLLTLLLSAVDRQAFVDLFLGVNLGYYASGLALYFCAFGVSAVRWHLILRAAGEPIGLGRVVVINLVGSFFSNFLPTAVGGDVVRIYELSRQGGSGAHTVSTVLVDRVIGLVSLVLMALVALGVGYRHVGERAVIVSVAGVSAGLVVGWGVFSSPWLLRRFRWVFRLPLIGRVEASARRLYDSLQGLLRQRQLMASALAVSLLVQATEVLSAILLARALHLHVPPVYFFIFLPLIWLVTMLPFSLSGIGLREGAFALFFGRVGVTTSAAVALSLLVYSCRLFVGVAGGLMFLRSSLGGPLPKAASRPEKTVISDQ